ncbi:MAG: ABC transporter substrate-binding protein [Burkholderiales bacterium]
MALRAATLLLAQTLFCALAWGAEPLVVALAKTPLSLPFYVAQSQGYFADEGVALKLNEVTGGHRTMQQLLDGQADIATSSEAVVVFSSFKRDDFSVIASFATSKDDVKVVTLAGSGITKAEHLKDRRVGTIIGSASNYYLDTLTLLDGVDPKSLKLVNLQPEAMSAALRGKQVDAIAVWQPHAFEAQKEIKDTRVLPDAGFYTLSFNIIVARALVQKRDDDLVKLLRALDRAQDFIATEPIKAKAILQNRLQLDAGYIDWIWPRYHYQLTLDQWLLTSLESEARWARAEGHVPAKASPNFLNLIHSMPLRRVRASAVGIAQ